LPIEQFRAELVTPCEEFRILGRIYVKGVEA